MPRARQGAPAALALIAVLAAAACAAGNREVAASSGAGTSDSDTAADGARRRSLVEVPPVDSSVAFLDPGAEPTTALGRLRAQHLPVWTSEFDWAFPPEACDTAWELDGIAEPISAGADPAVLGDSATAAALAVMRYEHQLSRALADPKPLSQLCVATASVDPARSEVLSLLASHIRNGTRETGPTAYPDEVTLVGGSETAVVAVACAAAADAGPDGGSASEPDPGAARLHAYRLSLSRGLEDQVVDIYYRVSNATSRSAGDCAALKGWILEWEDQVQEWIDEGRVWAPVGVALTADGICESPPPDGPDECPKDWQP